MTRRRRSLFTTAIARCAMNKTSNECTVPSEIAVFFKKPPLLIGESPSEYEAVFASLVSAVGPNNAFEWLLFKDLVDLSWDIRRLGKSKAAVINMNWKEALRMIAESLLEGDDEEHIRLAQELADQWFVSAEAREAVLKLLQRHQLAEDAIVAQATALGLHELEMLDRKIERARVSRMGILRDIEHHRVAGTWKMTKDLLQIVDAAAEPIPIAPPNDQVARAQ
jgi:hypothetical protein